MKIEGKTSSSSSSASPFAFQCWAICLIPTFYLSVPFNEKSLIKKTFDNRKNKGKKL